jgi:hypothetical protein
MGKEDEALPWLHFGLFFYLEVETFFRSVSAAAATAARDREREEEGGVSPLRALTSLCLSLIVRAVFPGSTR